MASAQLVYHPAVAHYNKFVATTVGRDKTLRVIQYFSRFLQWYTYRTNHSASTVNTIKAIQANFGLVRRALRLGKFVEHFKAAGVALSETKDPVLKYLQAGRQLGYALYFSWDNLTYPFYANLSPTFSKTSETMAQLQKRAYQAWLVGLLCNVAAGIYTYNLQMQAQKQKTQAGSDGEKTVELKALEKEKAGTRLQLISDLCDITIPTAGLKYLEFDDGIVGLAGTVSSLIGWYAAWQKTANSSPAGQDVKAN